MRNVCSNYCKRQSYSEGYCGFIQSAVLLLTNSSKSWESDKGRSVKQYQIFYAESPILISACHNPIKHCCSVFILPNEKCPVVRNFGFLVAHPVAPNNSRPISIRRISCVPAPISYSLASRSSRPVG